MKKVQLDSKKLKLAKERIASMTSSNTESRFILTQGGPDCGGDTISAGGTCGLGCTVSQAVSCQPCIDIVGD